MLKRGTFILLVIIFFLSFSVRSIGEENRELSSEDCDTCVSDDLRYMEDISSNSKGEITEEKILYYLWSEICTVCDSAKPFLHELESKYGVTVKAYEINADKEEAHKKFEEYNIERVAVPTLIYDGRVWQGFNQHIASEMKDYITSIERDSEEGFTFYYWNFKSGDFIIPTIIIGSIDGINPCSLWALMFLLSIVIRLNSRKKMLLVGGTFIAVIATIYGLYIVGLFGITINIINVFWLRVILFVMAITFAIITIKDFFTNKGISFSISPKNKNKYIQKVEEMILKKDNNVGLVAGTMFIALFASLIELPCTAGFPIIWNGFLAEQGVSMAQYIPLLILYLLMYILIELIVVLFATVTLSKIQMNFKVSMSIKLISGALIVYLGIILLMGPEYINNMALVTGGSAAITFFFGLFAYLYTSKY